MSVSDDLLEVLRCVANGTRSPEEACATIGRWIVLAMAGVADEAKREERAAIVRGIRCMGVDERAAEAADHIELGDWKA